MVKPVILAVDDDPQVRRAVERDLRRRYAREYRILRADSGESALDTLGKPKLRGDPVALFMVDQRMPRMRGVEFLEEAIERFPDAKRALLTAYSETEATIRTINEVEARGRVFEPFFTTKEVGAGIGLGLDIVRRVVAGHGGEVSVDSKPGETRFMVRLPKSERERGLILMEKDTSVFKEVCSERRGVNTEVLEQTVALAVEIAREGREGRKIGTLFVVGDTETVLKTSRPMILDPLQGHPEEDKRINDPNVRETLKELAQLDGAFVVSDEGVVLSAARYLDATSDALTLPLGLGSRHMAAASVSSRTSAVAVAVSESSMVRVFDNGELVSEIIPEVWMWNGYNSGLKGPTSTRQDDEVTVISRAE